MSESVRSGSLISLLLTLLLNMVVKKKSCSRMMMTTSPLMMMMMKKCLSCMLVVTFVIAQHHHRVALVRAQSSSTADGMVVDDSPTGGTINMTAAMEQSSASGGMTWQERMALARQAIASRFQREGADTTATVGGFTNETMTDEELKAAAEAAGVTSAVAPAAAAGALAALSGANLNNAQRLLRAGAVAGAGVGLTGLNMKRIEAKRAAEAESTGYGSTRTYPQYTYYTPPPPPPSAPPVVVPPSSSSSSYYYYYTPPSPTGSYQSVTTTMSPPAGGTASKTTATGSGDDVDPTTDAGMRQWAMERWQRLQGVIQNGGANDGSEDDVATNALRAESASSSADEMALYTAALAFASQVCPPPGDPNHNQCMDDTVAAYKAPVDGVSAEGALTPPGGGGDAAKSLTGNGGSGGGRKTLLTGEPCQIPFLDDAGRTHNDCMDLGEAVQACKTLSGEWAACAPRDGTFVMESSASVRATTVSLLATSVFTAMAWLAI